MAQFKNEFSWSVSRAQLFDQCARKCYYYYYGSWNGWLEEGSQHARLCYRLKQVVDLSTWAGDIVHRVIETTLNRWRRGQLMTLEGMQTMARNTLNREWKESTGGQWLRHPKKHVNLFEHYYNQEVTAEERAALREKVFDSLQAFEDMGHGTELRSVRPDDWLGVEDLQSFQIGETKVWVVIDCAFRRGGETVLYDWKTGRSEAGDWKTSQPGEAETATDQLICYALYAISAWGAPLDSIRVSPVYLPERLGKTHAVSAEQVIEFRERMFRSVERMKERLADAGRNTARESDFLRAQDTRLCRRCAFFEVCHGDRSLVPPKL